MSGHNQNNNWYPKSLTSTFLGVMLAVFSGIIINLLTSPLPTNLCLLLFFLAAIVLFILSSTASLILLKIRITIDDCFSKKVIANEKVEAKDKLLTDDLWKSALSETHTEQISKFILWKWLGYISLITGLILMFIINFTIRTEYIEQEKITHKNSTTIIDSFNNLQRKLDQQNRLVLQLTDSIKDIKKGLRLIKERSYDGEKPQTDNTVFKKSGR